MPSTMVPGVSAPPQPTDLLISYSWGRYAQARQEIVHILHRLGDPAPRVMKTSVPGIALARTALNNRNVIKQCHDLHTREQIFQFAIKWVPVDYWCSSQLDAMKKVIEEHIKNQIAEHQTWAMEVEKRTWQQYHTIEIVEYLAKGIDRKVNLNNPDKIVHIDVLGLHTAISLLSPGEIFSINLPYPWQITG